MYGSKVFEFGINICYYDYQDATSCDTTLVKHWIYWSSLQTCSTENINMLGKKFKIQIKHKQITDML